MELESTRSFSDELTAALASSDTSLAGRAALALGRTEDPRAAGPLKNATAAQDVSLRALAVYGYGLLGAKNPIDAATVALALKDQAGAVRVAAADAAWRAQAGGSPGAGALAGPLLALATDDSDPIVRGRAATALSGWTKAPDRATIATRIAQAFIDERDPSVREHEAWTLRRAFATITPAATVTPGLADNDETVRIQFADLVARRKDPAGIALLRPLLRDPSWRVREQTLESIRVLSGGKRTEQLTAIPAGVITPPPQPRNTDAPLSSPPTANAPLHRPTAAEALLELPLRPTTSALMNGPMPGPHPRVRIGTTQGTIVVRLYPEWAPLTVANFLNLVERHYYDGVRWYRVVPDFVAQSGGHLTGKPDNDVAPAGYTLPAEENPLEQRAGVISMGLDYTTGKDPHAKRDSANVEFYITISPQFHLNRDFTVFGRIESGFPVLGRLVERDRMTHVVRIADN
ncbi:MAG TPA: peptidylprolyl isomerase [Candidatus Elarobacter sp.]|nr:peptidylprolyl isomerase [Candidatus Elarobacter sp.]